MFEFVRKNTKVLQFVLFPLIVLSFAFVGVESYTRASDRGPVVAEVDGTAIHQSEWDAAHKAESDRVRQQMPSLDPKLLDSPEARYATLERMVRDRILATAARKGHLAVSDEALARELQRNPVIASLRGPDGKLDIERYKQLLAQQGYTPEGFEAQTRADLATGQVLAGISGTGLPAAAPARALFDAFLEKREIQVVRFDAAGYAAKLQPTDAEIEAYYKANPGFFQAPEQASIEYLVLDIESIKKGISVSEADLKTYYEQNTARLAGQEERRASHILLSAPKDAPADQRAAARKKAEDLIAQLRANPGSFADLARKNSQDPGSAARGGDLDFFARGAMVKPFEDAAFNLKKGETSAVVESDFGFHIIRLTDIKQPKVKTFEEMRPTLEAQLRQQQAQRKFAESAEAFSNAVYEQSDSLRPAAERFKLEVRSASGIRRQPATAGDAAKGPLASPKFLAALFSADSLDKKRNTEAVEVVPGQMVAGRITQFQPARTLPLAEVKDQVRERLKVSRGVELARKAGTEQLATWKATPAAATMPAAVQVSREQLAGQPRPVVEAALKAKVAGDAPAWVGVDLADAGYAVVKVAKVIPRTEPDANTAKGETRQYTRAWTEAESQAYYNLLKARFKVDIKIPRPQAPAEPARG
jgi:peptidyl-prolyl cis-trans isomerase D